MEIEVKKTLNLTNLTAHDCEMFLTAISYYLDIEECFGMETLDYWDEIVPYLTEVAYN